MREAIRHGQLSCGSSLFHKQSLLLLKFHTRRCFSFVVV